LHVLGTAPLVREVALHGLRQEMGRVVARGWDTRRIAAALVLLAALVAAAWWFSSNRGSNLSPAEITLSSISGSPSDPRTLTGRDANCFTYLAGGGGRSSGR